MRKKELDGREETLNRYIMELEALVEKAFKEGFSAGLSYMGRDPTIPDVESEWIHRKWLDSAAKRELYEEK